MRCSGCKDVVLKGVSTNSNKLLVRQEGNKVILDRVPNTENISTSDQVILSRRKSIAFLRSSKRSAEIAKSLETCKNCQKHIQEAIDKLEENIYFGEKGLSWDEGTESGWSIAWSTLKSITNLWIAGVKRIFKKRRVKKNGN